MFCEHKFYFWLGNFITLVYTTISHFLITQLNVSCNQVARISYNMATCSLPDIYTLALRPAALSYWVYISGKLLMHML